MYSDIDYIDHDVNDIVLENQDDQETSSSFTYIFEFCIKPTLIDMSSPIGRLFLCCIIFRVLAQHCDIALIWKHMSSTVLGLYIMHYYFNQWVLHIVFMVLAFYIIIHIIPKAKGMLMLLLMFVFLVTNESIIENDYTKIRGTEMLLGMKLVSLAFDVQPSAYTSSKRMPNFLEFTGYLFHVGTCIFGPWISYTEYINIFERKDTNVQCLWKVLRSFICSLLFFMLSVCIVEWVVPDDSHWWLIVYRDALLFRCGHYFVSFLSDTTTSLSGYSSLDSVCQPYYIEFPRSLNQVVVHWNVSMHKWLKYYVFRTSVEFGGFFSVLITYIVSALMHGLNYRLAGVLLSLGFYTYIEYSVRQKLAKKWNSCITARSCPAQCHQHKYSERMLPVTVFNLLCSFLSIFHLSYLGIVIDTTNSESVSFLDSFDRWYQLSFISHWVALSTFIFYLIIK